MADMFFILKLKGLVQYHWKALERLLCKGQYYVSVHEANSNVSR